MADCHEILHDAGKCVQFNNPGVKFWRALPHKIWGQKTCKIWPDSGRPQFLAANISGMDEDIQNRISTFSTVIPFVLGEKVW